METPIKVKDFIEQCKERKKVTIIDRQGFRVGEYDYYPESKKNKFIWFNGTGLILSKVKNYTITDIKDVKA